MSFISQAASRKKLLISPDNTLAVVHPLVLLSVVDHFHRTNGERAIGLLLGYTQNNKTPPQSNNPDSSNKLYNLSQYDINNECYTIHITNSFALPFDNNVEWHIDTQFISEALRLNNKVSKNEHVLGWYHTGPDLYSNDMEITEFFKNYNINCLMAIIDVKCEKMPVSVFNLGNKEFENLKTVIEAEEAEEVGVEHLLREVRDITLEKGYDKMSTSLKKKGDSERTGLNQRNSSKKDTHSASNIKGTNKQPKQHSESAIPFLTMTGYDVLAGLKSYKEKLGIVLSEISYIMKHNEVPKEEFLQLLLNCLKNVQPVKEEVDTATSRLSIDSTKKDAILSRPFTDGTEMVSAITKTYILGEDLINNRKEH